MVLECTDKSSTKLNKCTLQVGASHIQGFLQVAHYLAPRQPLFRPTTTTILQGFKTWTTTLVLMCYNLSWLCTVHVGTDSLSQSKKPCGKRKIVDRRQLWKKSPWSLQLVKCKDGVFFFFFAASCSLRKNKVIKPCVMANKLLSFLYAFLQKIIELFSHHWTSSQKSKCVRGSTPAPVEVNSHPITDKPSRLFFFHFLIHIGQSTLSPALLGNTDECREQRLDAE